MPSPLLRKGVLLAGGRGARLDPLTRVVNKHLLPVHGKPMIYYPLSTLLLGGIREILIVTNPEYVPAFETLLGDGASLGVRFSYAAQASPRGIADAFLLAENFLAGEGCALILGDSLFTGPLYFVQDASRVPRGATIYSYLVSDSSPYGVVELDAKGSPVGLEEKPARPRSKLAVPGLYVLDGDAVRFARTLTPSARGELEILDLLGKYLNAGMLRVTPLARDVAWLDMGTIESLTRAAAVVADIETHQGLRIGYLEEISVRMKYRTPSEMRATISTYPQSPYRAHLETLLEEMT